MFWSRSGSTATRGATSNSSGRHSSGGFLLTSAREGDMICCLDALNGATGQLLWSRCANQGQSCRMGDAREAVETAVDVLLWIQAVAVIAGIGSILLYRMAAKSPFKVNPVIDRT